MFYYSFSDNLYINIFLQIILQLGIYFVCVKENYESGSVYTIFPSVQDCK